MDMFEKVDKLRERANVSYEEAQNALDRSNGDILDAMILLEREGKTRKEGGECYSTSNIVTPQFSQDNMNYDEKKARRERVRETGRTFGEKVKALFNKSLENYLVIERNGEKIIKMPVLAMILILVFAWYAAIIAIVVSLFCDCKYSFEGGGNLKTANDVCEKAGDLANQVKDRIVDEYNKAKNEDTQE
ncbi:MAG: DUF4342 domain-containing protein [Lachnospiraceae bacterium]|nr:DUF4342 domain-containing protein [Lachnospiraceae bacterium]